MRWILYTLSALGVALFLYIGTIRNFHYLTQGSEGVSFTWVRHWLLGGFFLLLGTAIGLQRPQKWLLFLTVSLLFVGVFFSILGTLS